jgi:hypothetical protein
VPVDSAEDLYGLPLERFIDERATLTKQLRADNQTDEAKRVGALKKPTQAAWAVNQLVRTQGKAVRALFESGDALVEAQAGGRDAAEKLREAARRQRAALDELIGAAEGLLSSDGRPLSAGTLERVSETLRAAGIDADAREQVRSGCLARELTATGLLGLSAAPAAPAPAETEKPKPREDDQRRRAAQKAAQKAEQQAKRQAEKALRRLHESRAAVERAQAALEGAQGALAEARGALAEARGALAEARGDLGQAEREAKQASDALVEAQRRRAELEA